MKTQKLNLSKLNIDSFVTSIATTEKQTIQGAVNNVDTSKIQGCTPHQFTSHNVGCNVCNVIENTVDRTWWSFCRCII